MGEQQEPETQKLRSALQGTTFKFADEAEAYLRSVSGENYDTALKDIRLKIKTTRNLDQLSLVLLRLAHQFPYL